MLAPAPPSALALLLALPVLLALCAAAAAASPRLPTASVRSAKCPIVLPTAGPTSTADTAARSAATPFIRNGDPAAAHLLPYLVALGRSSGSFFRQSCTGALLNPTHILTAAHCLSPTRPTTVVFNTRVVPNSAALSRSVRSVTPHPQYSPQTRTGKNFDIGIVELDEPAPISDATPIWVNVNPSIPESESFVRAVGYGLTIAGVATIRSELNMVDMPSNPNRTCRDAWSNSDGPTDPAFHICAGYYDRGDCSPCSGDSGGPLIQYDSSRNPVVLGVVSYGTSTCGEPRFPTVFVRTSVFASWLDTVVVSSYTKARNTAALFVEGASTSESGAALSTTAIAAIVAGAAVAVLIALAITITFVRKRRSVAFDEQDQPSPGLPVQPIFPGSPPALGYLPTQQQAQPTHPPPIYGGFHPSTPPVYPGGPGNAPVWQATSPPNGAPFATAPVDVMGFPQQPGMSPYRPSS